MGATNTKETLKRVSSNDPTLSVLDLSQCVGGVSLSYWPKLVSAMRKNTNLQVLKLGQENKDGIPHVATILAMKNCSITVLDLSGMGVFGSVPALANAIQINTSLITLNLNACQLGAEKVKMIVEAVAKNPNIKNFDISINFMMDEGVAAVVELLRTNTTLSNLNLQKNSITDYGAKILIEALQNRQKTLGLKNITIKMEDNGVMDEELNQILSPLCSPNAPMHMRSTLNLNNNNYNNNNNTHNNNNTSIGITYDSPTTTTTTTASSSLSLKQQQTCIVCLEKGLEVLFEPCAHIVCCVSCAEQVSHCPQCRVSLSKKRRVYIG